MKFGQRILLLVLVLVFCVYLFAFWLFGPLLTDFWFREFAEAWQLAPKPSTAAAVSLGISPERRAITVFCIILTQPKNFKKRMPATYKTWVSQCDNHRFISILSSDQSAVLQNKPSSLEFSTPHGIILQPRGLVRERYLRLTDKVFYAIREIYKRFDGYDWYLKADDDTFVFMNSLRKFVRNKSSSHPVSYGYNFKAHVRGGYQSGGAGYLMSNEAFKRIGIILNSDPSYCQNSGFEDIDVGRCLRKLSVELGNSTDQLGRERFHPLPPLIYAKQRFPKWLNATPQNRISLGLECCSDESISYHYIRNFEMELIDSLIQYRLRKDPENTSIPFSDILRLLNLKMVHRTEPEFDN